MTGRDLDARIRRLLARFSPGNSGGPLTNDRGEVIGITSWTKPDAQNISFAVPVRELLTLNQSHPLTPWTELAPLLRPPQNGQRSKSSSAPVLPPREAKATGTLDSMMEFFQDMAGDTLTGIVQGEGGHENRFKFTVPPHGLK